MKIKYLSDVKNHLDEVAQWLYDQWGGYYFDSSLDEWREKIRERLNKRKVPTTFVAFKEEKPVGTASLVKHDMDTRMDLTPWMADVYVKPDWRGQGIASELVKRVEKEAQDIEIESIYLFTRKARGLYEKLDWQFMESTEYHGHEVDMMYKKL